MRPLLLALDASQEGASLAMVQGQRVLATIGWSEAQSAGRRLVDWVQAAVEAFGRPDRLAVGVGPGSYTGSRVAVTAAKTLAWAWDCPLVAVSSLQALAATVADRDVVVLASAERRGDDVYAGRYWRGRHGAEPLEADGVYHVSDLLGGLRASEDLTVAGPLAEDRAMMACGRSIRPARREGPIALGVARVAAAGQGAPADPLTLEPHYIRRPPPVPPLRGADVPDRRA